MGGRGGGSDSGDRWRNKIYEISGYLFFDLIFAGTWLPGRQA